jgi:hypothetical protein
MVVEQNLLVVADFMLLVDNQNADLEMKKQYQISFSLFDSNNL